MGAKIDRMADTQDDFRAIFEGAPDPMFAHDLRGRIVLVNRAFERITGFGRGELIGTDFLDLVLLSDREEARARLFERLGGGTGTEFGVRLLARSGEVIELQVTTELAFEDGRPAGIQGYARQAGQWARFARYLRLLHRLSTTTYPFIDLLFRDYLATGCEIFGAECGAITAGDGNALHIIGDAESDLFAADVIASRETVSRETESGFYLGTPIVIDESVYGTIGFWSSRTASDADTYAREVLEMLAKSIAVAIHQRQLTDLLAFQANHDALTGLPNRLMLQRELDLRLVDAAEKGKTLAVIFVDLDRFKQINDTLGHEIGDLVLEQIAAKLNARMQPDDILARLGGDEFTAVLTNCDTADEAAEYARELLAAVRTPHQVAGRELFVTASIGISLYPKDGADAATLLRHADSAMYAAKHRTTDDVHFFTAGAGVGATARRRLELETHLRRALERSELQIQYQPQVDLEGHLASLEALLVWESPELGRISPSQFIPIAEETGMILAIGSWVIRQACEQIASWRRSGLDPVPLAVNVSALQIAEPTFVETVATALADAGIPAHALELELTESIVVRDAEAAAALMHQLRAIGVRIAIDDFGTGYSSLSYLRQLPVHAVKIDQSFLEGSEYGPAALALIRAIVVLAHNIGLTVTAEGVETEEQLQLIRKAGCDRAQGHLFGASLPSDAIEALLRDRSRTLRR
jgi:diguanylate cyclase (GGDEF)-like protein/PAS domain S-box-containing protein